MRPNAMKLSRRKALIAATAAFAGTQVACAGPVAPPPQSAAQPPQPRPTGWVEAQAPGFYRMKIGDFRLTVLSDGTASRDLPKIMSKPAEVSAAFDACHQRQPTNLSINCFLIDTGAQRIMIDTGAGELFGPTSGKLVDNLRLAGYQPENIDAILLTHIHGDHSGGLSVGGKIVFPNATVHVNKLDVDYWLNNKEAEAHAPADHKATFAQSHQTVDPAVRAGTLKPFEGEVTLFPGVRTVPIPGHTLGLTGYLLESQGQQALFWGDIVHAAEVQFRDPTVTVEYDVDPGQAAASRASMLETAAQQGYLIGGAHLSFPGLGHVRAEQAGYSWAPIPYAAQP